METLKERIRAAFREITKDVLVRVCQSFVRRTQVCLQNNGHQFEHLLH